MLVKDPTHLPCSARALNSLAVRLGQVGKYREVLPHGAVHGAAARNQDAVTIKPDKSGSRIWLFIAKLLVTYFAEEVSGECYELAAPSRKSGSVGSFGPSCHFDKRRSTC